MFFGISRNGTISSLPSSARTITVTKHQKERVYILSYENWKSNSFEYHCGETTTNLLTCVAINSGHGNEQLNCEKQDNKMSCWQIEWEGSKGKLKILDLMKTR